MELLPHREGACGKLQHIHYHQEKRRRSTSEDKVTRGESVSGQQLLTLHDLLHAALANSRRGHAHLPAQLDSAYSHQGTSGSQEELILGPAYC